MIRGRVLCRGSGAGRAVDGIRLGAEKPEVGIPVRDRSARHTNGFSGLQAIRLTLVDSHGIPGWEPMRWQGPASGRFERQPSE